MTPDPVVVDISASVSEAASAMRDEDVGSVIVLDEGQAVGILTDRDIVTRAVAEGRRAASTDVGAICTRNIVTLSPGDTVGNALRLMQAKALRRLPVVRQGQAIGIVTMADIAGDVDDDSAFEPIASAPPNR